jgi:hypothetical protein
LRDYLDRISILVKKSVNRSIKAESKKLEFVHTQPIPTNPKPIPSEFSSSMTDWKPFIESLTGNVAFKTPKANLHKRGLPSNCTDEGGCMNDFI